MRKYVGVDLHKKQITVCWMDEEDEKKYKVEEYSLNQEGFKKFEKKLSEGMEVAVEATGNSGYFCDAIRSKVKKVIVINPMQFRVISTSVKKTDENDAVMIAKYLKLGLLPEVRQMDKGQRELRSLINTRDKLVKLRSCLKNKIHNILNENGIVSQREMFSSEVSLERVKQAGISETGKFEIGVIVEQIRSLTKSINEIEEKIKDTSSNLPGHKNLKSITGVGDLSAAIILNGVGDIKDFDDAKKLCAYVGLVPSVRNSADTVSHGHITRRGNKVLRTTLVQVALIAIKYSSYMRKFYDRLKAKKGSGKAIIATARKMLEVIYNTLKNGWVFADFNNFVLE
jgi:transposase